MAASLFGEGSLEVKLKSVDPSQAAVSDPPKQLIISYPAQEGAYGVVLFLHGFCISNSFYKGLFSHISSYGYIVVAPRIIYPCMHDEIGCAVRVANWLPKGLQPELPLNVRADFSKLTLAGHSRGGKSAFCMLLHHVPDLSVRFSALIGVDPVAGFQIPCIYYSMEIPPKIITNDSRPFAIEVPKLVIGTELGEESKSCMAPPCAPAGLNHEQFFKKSEADCYHFWAKGYGHMDMLDDVGNGDIMGKLTYCMCKNGKDRKPMRRCVGGLVVAFLIAYVEGKKDYLMDILKNPGIAPLSLEAKAKIN